MNVQPMAMDKEAALVALKEYRAHRSVYDARDKEIERIYYAISRGRKVISVTEALRAAGFDERNRPKLAISRADDLECFCSVSDRNVTFSPRRNRHSQRSFDIKWPEAKYISGNYGIKAAVPRIPPKHRPATEALDKYHILWEADWVEYPRDPYLLKRIGKDAWVVLAAWDLTDVEISVLRAHQ